MKKISGIIVLLIVQGSLNPAAQAVIGQKLPNLIIDSITPGPSRPQVGEECTITVRVRNIGNETARNFDVCLWKNHDGEPADNTGADAFLNVSSLASGEKKSLEFRAVWPQGGTFSIWALADSGNVVNELDKTDNTRSCLILVAPSSNSSPNLLDSPTPTPTPASESSSTKDCFIPGISLPFLLFLAYFLIGKLSD